MKLHKQALDGLHRLFASAHPSTETSSRMHVCGKSLTNTTCATLLTLMPVDGKFQKVIPDIALALSRRKPRKAWCVIASCQAQTGLLKAYGAQPALQEYFSSQAPWVLEPIAMSLRPHSDCSLPAINLPPSTENHVQNKHGCPIP